MHVRICTDILRKIAQRPRKYQNTSSVKKHSSSFEFPARNIITRRTWHAVLHPFSKLSFAVHHAGEWHIHVPYVHGNTHTHTKRHTKAKCARVYDTTRRRTYNREMYDGMCSSGKLRTVFSTVAYESCCRKCEGKSEARKMEANERVSRKSSSRERLSRQVSCSTLRAAARFPRARHENASRTFSGSAVRLFPDVCLRVCALHICMYILRLSAQFIRDKSGEESNAISRIEFSSGAEKIWVLVRVSPGRNARARKCQFIKKLRLVNTIFIRTYTKSELKSIVK